MRDRLIRSLTQRFESYDDLVATSSDEQLAIKLEVVKHKSLGEHLWCVVGARESYAKAIEAGEWSGFGCTLQSLSLSDISKTLQSSSKEVIKAIESVDDWTDEREEYLLTLVEHEVMHEGQIIRHLYGADQIIPESIRWA